MVAHEATWLDSEIRCHDVAIAERQSRCHSRKEKSHDRSDSPKQRLKAAPKAKKKLTDKRSEGTLKPTDKPFEIMDLDVRGFGIRVMPSGVKSFILFRRFPGSKHPARRSLGTYGEMSLAEARDKAREWNALVEKGIDPTKEKQRQRQAAIEAEKQRQASTFGAAFEDYLHRKASKLKSAKDIECKLRRECKSWMALPLADISPLMVKEVVQAMVARGTSGANARFWFANIRAFFNWCHDSTTATFEVSPCAKLKPTVLIGPPNVRDRVLKDFEIAAYWRASQALRYPLGQFFQLLALTALRLNEACQGTMVRIRFQRQALGYSSRAHERRLRSCCAVNTGNFRLA